MPASNMLPLIPLEATLAIDLGMTRVVEGETYALLHNGVLRVNNLSLGTQGTLYLHSHDRRNYAVERYTRAQRQAQPQFRPGYGAFACTAARHAPQLQVQVFDLPGVVARAAQRSGQQNMVGLGVDEDTALCVEADGTGQVLTLGFFLTPILYDRAGLPAQAAFWLGLNPMAAPVEAVRRTLTGQSPDWLALGGSLAVALALLWLANALFRRARSHLEDFL